MGKKLLEVKDLHTSFFTANGEVKSVNGVSYYIDEHEIVAVVGESGCGKSVTQMSVMQLVQSPPGKIKSGEVLLEDKNLLEYGPRSKEMQAVRGAQIAMIFQEPMTSLDPVYTVGNQLCEVIRKHRKCTKKEAWQIGVQALADVGIPDPESRMKNYPFEMSGGMRQRAMIATAVACQSKLIICDEPTTALDVTTQAQVMEVLQSLVDKFGTSLLIVTHNLGLVTRYATVFMSCTLAASWKAARPRKSSPSRATHIPWACWPVCRCWKKPTVSVWSPSRVRRRTWPNCRITVLSTRAAPTHARNVRTSPCRNCAKWAIQSTMCAAILI